MAFQLTPLQIPNMRTDYSAENSAFSSLGQTLGNMPSEFRKEQLNAQKQQQEQLKLQQEQKARDEYARIGKAVADGTINNRAAAGAVMGLGDISTGFNFLKLDEAAKDRARDDEWLRQNSGILGGAAAPSASSSPASSGIIRSGQPSGSGGAIPSAAYAADAQSNGLHVTSAYRGPDHPLTRANPNSPHAQGNAWDLRARTPEEGDAVMARQRELLTSRGLVEGRDYKIIDEVRNPARHATGPHIHVQLTPEGAARHGRGQQAPGVQVAENEADVQRLEAQQGPVQVAQAPGPDPQSDARAPGGANAQFFVPPGQAATDASIANDPRVINLQRALAGAPERYKPAVQSRLNILVEELKAQRQQSAPTDVQRNYELARRQGYQGTLLDYQKELRAQTNVSLKNEGTIPAGYRAVRDSQGNVERLEPIPGSEAAKKAEEAVTKDERQKAMLAQTGMSVFSALDDIDRTKASSRFPVAGGMSGVLASIPGTGAHNVAQSLNTIRANISFERLNQMRQASPTGGALGAVSDSEQRLLSNSLAALEQSQDTKQFDRNLQRVRAAFEKVVHGKVLSADERASEIKAREAEINGEPEKPKGSAPPKRGELIDGYRYKGGNPADPNSWVKVK